LVAERVEKMKASIRAKVEHPFRVLKRQFGYTKVRWHGGSSREPHRQGERRLARPCACLETLGGRPV